MSGVIDFMTAVETQILKEIKRSDFFADVAVLTDANGDLVAKIQEALAGLGLFVVVRMLGGKIPAVGDSERWPLTIEIVENPLLNRIGNYKTARLCLQKLMPLLATSPILTVESVENVPQEGMALWAIRGKVPVYLPGAI
jgi:hypothetical protein